MFPAVPPPDVFDHFERVLAPGHEIVTGRKNQRLWRVGGIQTSADEQLLIGKLGWQPTEGEVVSDWLDDEKDWVPVEAKPRNKVIPFGFDGERRILAVLREASSAPTTIAAVFERILRENEAELPEPTTEWSVEPILDTGEFLEWLGSLDYARYVSFTVKLPNPEPPKGDFEDLAARLDRTGATQITEMVRSDREEGLDRANVANDPEIRGAIAMGQQGFASLRGEGTRDGTVTKFNQKETVAREHVDALPDTWTGMWDLLKSFLKDRARNFLDEEQLA